MFNTAPKNQYLIHESIVKHIEDAYKNEEMLSFFMEMMSSINIACKDDISRTQKLSNDLKLILEDEKQIVGYPFDLETYNYCSELAESIEQLLRLYGTLKKEQLANPIIAEYLHNMNSLRELYLQISFNLAQINSMQTILKAS